MLDSLPRNFICHLRILNRQGIGRIFQIPHVCLSCVITSSTHLPVDICPKLDNDGNTPTDCSRAFDWWWCARAFDKGTASKQITRVVDYSPRRSQCINVEIFRSTDSASITIKLSLLYCHAAFRIERYDQNLMIVVIRWWTLGVWVLCIVQQRVFGYERSLPLSEKNGLENSSPKNDSKRDIGRIGEYCLPVGWHVKSMEFADVEGILTGRNMTSNSHEEKLESRAGVHQIRTVPSLASRKKENAATNISGMVKVFTWL